MPNTRYFIVRQDQDWLIKFENEEYGPYHSCDEAMLFAIDAAQKLGEHGQNPQVCLLGDNGHFTPAWTFGQDPYPPSL
jgi:hypothetical protein